MEEMWNFKWWISGGFGLGTAGLMAFGPDILPEGAKWAAFAVFFLLVAVSGIMVVLRWKRPRRIRATSSHPSPIRFGLTGLCVMSLDDPPENRTTTYIAFVENTAHSNIEDFQATLYCHKGWIDIYPGIAVPVPPHGTGSFTLRPGERLEFHLFSLRKGFVRAPSQTGVFTRGKADLVFRCIGKDVPVADLRVQIFPEESAGSRVKSFAMGQTHATV